MPVVLRGVLFSRGAGQELILKHAKLLVEMENSGCKSMFRDDKVSICFVVYRYCSCFLF